MKIFIENGIKYCLKNNILYTGDCVWTNRPNALAKESSLETLVIPCFVRRYPVKIVANWSFSNCVNIKHIVIQARITEIQKKAFSGIPGLKSINIPNTCTFIGDHAIQCHTLSDLMSNGTLNVVFEKGSYIKTLIDEAFSYKQYINIYTCESISPTTGKLFYLAEAVHIYSPVSFTFNYKKYPETQVSKASETFSEMHCYTQPGCVLPKLKTCKRSNNDLHSLYLLILINK